MNDKYANYWHAVMVYWSS